MKELYLEILVNNPKICISCYKKDLYNMYIIITDNKATVLTSANCPDKIMDEFMICDFSEIDWFRGKK